MRIGTHQVPNLNWHVSKDRVNADDVHHAILATLMDIREELRAVSGRLDCHETLSIPRTLLRIARNTGKPKKRKRA